MLVDQSTFSQIIAYAPLVASALQIIILGLLALEHSRLRRKVDTLQAQQKKANMIALAAYNTVREEQRERGLAEGNAPADEDLEDDAA